MGLAALPATAEDAAEATDETADPAALVALARCEVTELATEAADLEAEAPPLAAAEDADATTELREDARDEAEDFAPDSADETLDAPLSVAPEAEPYEDQQS